MTGVVGGGGGSVSGRGAYTWRQGVRGGEGIFGGGDFGREEIGKGFTIGNVNEEDNKKKRKEKKKTSKLDLALKP